MDKDKKMIYFLISLIILLSIILLIKIKTMPNYDPKIYNEIYDEYEDIFGENNNEQYDRDSMQNIKEKSSIAEKPSNSTTVVGLSLQNNTEKGNVIGKISIPKIGINYPIIKVTTTEYLKIAPTKYCGPEVNEIRKFSYSRS